MGLKGYRLWAMGQLDSTCRAPPRAAPPSAPPRRSGTNLHLKPQTLKPVSHLIGSRAETGRFQARWVNRVQLAPPHHVAPPVLVVRRVLVRRGVVRHTLRLKSATFVSGFSRWVKGQAQGLQPGGFKLWVNWIRELLQPRRGARRGGVHFDE
jgi:hypothetical protein